LLKDAPTRLLERAFRDYEDISRVLLPLAQYGDGVLQIQDHVLTPLLLLERYSTKTVSNVEGDFAASSGPDAISSQKRGRIPAVSCS
jgi:hypothetical protein